MRHICLLTFDSVPKSAALQSQNLDKPRVVLLLHFNMLRGIILPAPGLVGETKSQEDGCELDSKTCPPVHQALTHGLALGLQKLKRVNSECKTAAVW